jgi:hypothetical protein
MTLDEAIKHEEEVMVENMEKTKGRNASDPIAINCFECAEEHRQLAEWLKDYKRLKEQESCEDCISRKAAIVQLSYNKIGNDDYEAIIQDDINTIKALPPVIPKPKTEWILVSERLPEEAGFYMTTIDYGKHRVATEERYYYGQNLGWDDDNDNCVIAWMMPLPDPYKVESEDRI